MPEPTNNDRADWAELGVNAFALETYCGRTFTDTVVEQPERGDDAYCMIVDLIADALHLANRHGWDTEAVVRSAIGAFDDEVAEEACTEVATCVRCGNTDNDGSDVCPDCGDAMQDAAA